MDKVFIASFIMFCSKMCDVRDQVSENKYSTRTIEKGEFHIMH